MLFENIFEKVAESLFLASSIWLGYKLMNISDLFANKKSFLNHFVVVDIK